jgi:hypothetical protein
MSRRDNSMASGRAFASTLRALRFLLRQVARLVMVVVLLVMAIGVSLGLANVGRERPTTEAIGSQGSQRGSAGDATEADTSEDSSTSSTVAGAAGAADATAQTTSDLLSAEDERVLRLVRSVPFQTAPYVVQTRPVDTLVLTARATAYDRASLRELGALTRLDDGSDYVDTSVLVAPGAQLRLDGDRKLRLRSDRDGFASVVAWKGELRVTGTANKPLAISSWNPAKGHADRREQDGRAYVRTVDSRTALRHASFRDLGFWSGRTGGLAVEGGVTAAALATPATAPDRTSVLVSDVATRRLHYGLFANDIPAGVVRRSIMLDSTVQGLLLHGGSRDIEVDSTTVQGSGADGVQVSRGSHDVTLRDVVSDGNAGAGIRVDGRPLASGPSAAGADLRRHGRVRIVGAELSGNSGSGAAVVGAVEVKITDSALRDNRDGITVRDQASDVRLTGNEVLSSAGFGIGVTDGPSKVVVADNIVSGAETGVALRSAVATVRGNVVTGATEHGVSLSGRAPGSQVLRNRIDGTGPAAVGLSRLVSPQTVMVSANTTSDWEVRKDLSLLQRLEAHPLLLLWLPILLLPILAAGVSLRRRARAKRSRVRGRGRLSMAQAVTTAAATNHPSRSEPDPDTRTRVTVMA